MIDKNVVEATAKIEQGRYANGSEVLGPDWCPVNKYGTGTVIDPKTGEVVEVKPDSFVSPYAYKFVISITDKPVFFDQIKDLDPDLRVTKGMYMIKYVPRTSKDYKKGRPWKIGQDLLRWDIRVSGPKYWHEICRKVPELAWIERNSMLTDELFDLAARHPGMTFWFSVDWVKYVQKIEAQCGFKTLTPLVSYKCSVEKFKNIYKDKCATIRYFNDILKEVNDVEASDAVQKEMQDTSGELYTRSRIRDPKTGRILKVNKDSEEE